MRPTPYRSAASISATLLLLPWKPIRSAGKAGSDRHGQLATGADVQPQALLVDPPCHGGAQESLAGVVDVGATAEIPEDLIERLLEVSRTRTEVVLVNHVCRGAEVSGDLADVKATDGQRPRRPDGPSVPRAP